MALTVYLFFVFIVIFNFLLLYCRRIKRKGGCMKKVNEFSRVYSEIFV